MLDIRSRTDAGQIKENDDLPHGCLRNFFSGRLTNWHSVRNPQPHGLGLKQEMPHL